MGPRPANGSSSRLQSMLGSSNVRPAPSSGRPAGGGPADDRRRAPRGGLSGAAVAAAGRRGHGQQRLVRRRGQRDDRGALRVLLGDLVLDRRLGVPHAGLGEASAGAQPHVGALEQLEQVLHVRDVLGVQAVAHDADQEREAADEQADHGDGERGHQVVGELLDVAAGEPHEGGGQRDQGTHEAQHGADAHEDPGPLEPLDRVELVLLQELQRLGREALRLVVADEVVEEADDDQGVVVLLQVPVGRARLAVAERLARAQGADLERVKVAVAEPQPQLVQQHAELDEHPDEADDGGDEDGPEKDPGDVVDELLKVVH